MKRGIGLRKWRTDDPPRPDLSSVSKARTDPEFGLFFALASKRCPPGNVQSEDSIIPSSVQPDLPATGPSRDHGWHGRRLKRGRQHGRRPPTSRRYRTKRRLENEAAFSWNL